MSPLRMVLIGLVLAGSASAQDLGPVIDSTFTPLRRSDAPGCTVGVRHEGQEWLRSYGMSNLEYGISLSPESVLETGSVAKQFTAAAIGLLALEGKLSLEDDVRKYIPEVPDFGKTITLRHLLNHTSGLRDQWGLLAVAGRPPGEAVHTIPEILDLVSRQRMLNFAPGEEYLYSNTGWALLGVVVTRASGTPFFKFSQERLFEPLGMRHTEWREDYRKVVPGRATAYDQQNGRWSLDMPFTRVHGNGGLLTTVSDLLTWNQALSDSTIPGGAALVRMLETRGKLNDGSSIEYALGLSVGAWRGEREISHGGSTAGYRTYLTRYPDQRLSIAVLCNQAGVNPTGFARRIAGALIPERAPVPPAPAVRFTGDLQALTGVYRDTTTDQMVTFGIRNDSLTASGNGPVVPLAFLGDGRFWSPVAGEYRFEAVGEGWRVRQFNEAWRTYLPHEPAADGVSLSEYAGRFRSPELDVVLEVTVEENRLRVQLGWAQVLYLSPIYRDGFRTQAGTFRFTRDGAGTVNGLRIFAGRVRDLRFEPVGETP